MDQKTRERLTAFGFVAGGILLFYLATRQPAAASGGNSLSLGGSTYGPPNSVSTDTPGGITYNNGGLNIPALQQQLPPSVTFPGSGPGGGGDCCCGCDASSSGVNGFATSVQGALTAYAQQMQQVEAQADASLLGSIPASVAPYLTVADVNANSGLNA